MRAGAAFEFEIVAAIPRAFDLQCAVGDAVPRQFIALVVDDPQLAAEYAAAGLGLQRVHFFLRQVLHACFRRVDRSQRAHFGHAPTLANRYVMLFAKLADHRFRHRCATNDRPFELVHAFAGLVRVLQQGEPHRRHTEGQGHRFRLE